MCVCVCVRAHAFLFIHKHAYIYPYIHLYIYIYIYIQTNMYLQHILSSSSCVISTDIPDPLLLPLPLVHRLRQVLRATPHIHTELLYVGSSWSPCFCLAI